MRIITRATYPLDGDKPNHKPPPALYLQMTLTPLLILFVSQNHPNLNISLQKYTSQEILDED